MNNSGLLKIKPLRERAGLSQRKLAQILKVAQPLIVAYESGDKTPSAHRLPALAAALGVGIHELFTIDTPADSIPSVN